jgi:hypothetical protein
MDLREAAGAAEGGGGVGLEIPAEEGALGLLRGGEGSPELEISGKVGGEPGKVFHAGRS